MVKDLRRWLPEHVSVEWLGDRAFGYRELYELLASYGWHYTIRFRENIKVYERGDAICLPASACVRDGRVRKIMNAQLTHKRFEVPAAVLVNARA